MAAIIWMAVAVFLIVAVSVRRSRRRRHISVGSAAGGTIYDWLHEDKRRAIEIIVEERAEARDPEDRDGNLPELVNPKQH